MNKELLNLEEVVENLEVIKEVIFEYGGRVAPSITVEVLGTTIELPINADLHEFLELEIRESIDNINKKDSIANRVKDRKEGIGWVEWKDLTEREKVQAVNSLIVIRGDEEGVPYDEVDFNINNILDCSFERMEDGYIFVNV